MVNDEIINESDAALQSKSETSKLAIVSVVFGILGPLSTGVMWLTSHSQFLSVGSLLIVPFFSYGIAWILGLASGVKSLEQIENSKGQLHGKEYAIVGIVTSAVWLFLILVCLFFAHNFFSEQLNVEILSFTYLFRWIKINK
jgi:uncharacterized membrane protein